MVENKKQLINQANELAEQHKYKKELIETILNDLDKKKELTNSHLEAMGTIQKLLTELDDIEEEYEKITLKIKK